MHIFRQPHPLPEGALNCRWPAAQALSTTERGVGVWVGGGGGGGGGGERETTTIIYNLYCLPARWTVHAKIDYWGILLYLHNLCLYPTHWPAALYVA